MSLFLVLALGPAAAPAERYSFKYYGHAEGLGALAVDQLYQDRSGFLWVATANGLFRYDGAQFARFDRNDGLPSSRIRSIHETATGDLWVGTDSGLARLDGRRFATVALPQAAEMIGKFAIESDRAGRLWVGTARALLVGEKSAAGAWQFKPAAAAGSIPLPVYGVHADPSGAVWFGCGRRLCRVDANFRVTILDGPGLSDGPWERFLTDASGTLWIRGTRRLLARPPGTSSFTARDGGLPQATNSVDLCLDWDGRIMVATDLGVARPEGSGWRLIGTDNGLESEAVTALLLDQEGSVWLGLWGTGLARWLGRDEWRGWTSREGLSNGLVWAIRRDTAGTLWVGTDNGLNEIHPGARREIARVWTEKDGLGGNKIKAIATGLEEELWIGSSPGGVSRLDLRHRTVRRFGARDGLKDERVVALLLDPDDRLWVSTVTGLYRSGPVTDSGLRFERESVPLGEDGEIFYRFLYDRRGRLWVGGEKGLARLENGQWSRFTRRDGLKQDAVTHIAEAEDGSYWIGYRQALGVTRVTFDGGVPRCRHFTVNEGLSSDYVLFLGRDAAGGMWVGTDRGVNWFKDGFWRRFGQPDGMVWEDCAANAFLADPDGGVWIGTLRGMSHFKPSRSPGRKSPPRIFLTSVQMAGTELDPTLPKLKIPFRRDTLSLSFASPTFLNEKAVRFRYRMAGLENGWTETDQREARYSAIGPGAYAFEVSSRNAAGEWSTQPARIAIEILPPWWRTGWFVMLAMAGGIVLVSASIHWRVRSFVRERERLALAVRERTAELEERTATVEAQKREIETLLEQSREASRLKSEFLANMSHEIRTPMNGIIGMASLALTSNSQAEQKECLEMVRDCGDTLLTLLNEILDLSKIEANRLELDLVRFSLSELIQDTTRTLAPVANHKRLRLISNPEEAPAEEVVGDPVRLRQILFNLLGNAIKFTDAGEIRVWAERDARESHGGRPLVHISVSDTGIGIPADKLHVVFEPFRQADGSTSRRYGGTGLGLAICARLVELMHGRIWVESEPGRGSTFHFTVDLPPAQDVLPREESGRQGGPPGPRETRPLRVLVAEDNAVNQRLTVRLLERAGHTPLVARDGLEVLRVLDSEPVDLVLMDVQMPDLDGLQTTAAIREREKNTGAHLPIVALTAYAMHSDQERCLEAGMDAYISKPIHPEELHAALLRYSA